MNVPGLAALAIDIVGHQTATVSRPSGEYILGEFTPTTSAAFSITGTITPATGKDMRRLPEGRRKEAAIRIITKTELRISQQGQNADLVTFDGDVWEVEHVQEWADEFYDAVAVRRGG